MNPFIRHDGLLYCESVALDAVAREFGTPCYVYSSAALTEAYRNYDNAFATHPHQICYAVKANPNLAILNLFAQLGAGFDIVSGGELARVLAAGGNPGKIVFSGVGKTGAEMEAALSAGIHCFNVESESELARLNDVAGRMHKTAPVSFRINPDVDAKTHPYIATGLKTNKFGIAYADAPRMYETAAQLPHLKVVGVDCHIGSQLTESAPFGEALDKVLDLVDRLAAKGIELQHIDLGGGLGVRYQDETPPVMDEYAGVLLSRLRGRSQKLILEPGRSLVANAGLLLTRVEYLKHGEAKDFAIVDAAMNDLMRPSLYDAWHDVQPVLQREGEKHSYEIVGPVCESGDFLAHDRDLALAENDLLALLSAGAYGMSMSSNYNTRPRVAEVLVKDKNASLIRRREKLDALFADEIVDLPQQH
jgi:diaminopimelate decarboxylase